MAMLSEVDEVLYDLRRAASEMLSVFKKYKNHEARTVSERELPRAAANTAAAAESDYCDPLLQRGASGGNNSTAPCDCESCSAAATDFESDCIECGIKVGAMSYGIPLPEPCEPTRCSVCRGINYPDTTEFRTIARYSADVSSGWDTRTSTFTGKGDPMGIGGGWVWGPELWEVESDGLCIDGCEDPRDAACKPDPKVVPTKTKV